MDAFLRQHAFKARTAFSAVGARPLLESCPLQDIHPFGLAGRAFRHVVAVGLAVAAAGRYAAGAEGLRFASHVGPSQLQLGQPRFENDIKPI